MVVVVVEVDLLEHAKDLYALYSKQIGALHMELSTYYYYYFMLGGP